MSVRNGMNRLSRLECVLGRADGFEPVGNLSQFYEALAIGVDYERRIAAGECAHGENLEPRALRLLREYERLYGKEPDAS